MPTAKEVLDDADGRYRNTFQLPQKLQWLNYCYWQVRKKLGLGLEDELETSIIITTAGVNLYNYPDGVTPLNVRTIDMETGNGSGKFVSVPFKFIQDDNDSTPYWTTLHHNEYFIINPTPVDQRAIVVYYVPESEAITEANYNSFVPDLPPAYHEMLVYMMVERYAAARKDTTMKSNYASDANMLEDDLRWSDLNSMPEYPSCRDVMPRRAGKYGSSVGNYWTD